MTNIIKNFLKSKYSSILLIVGLMIAGVIVRSLFLNTDFWYDEAFSAIVVKMNWKEMLEVIRLDRVHPPTFYILLKLWGLLFGYGVNAIRSFSMFWGILLIPLSFITVKELFRGKDSNIVGGILAAIVFTFSPFFILYSVEARTYTFLGFLGMLSLFLFLKAVSTKKTKYYLFFALVALLMVMTHYLSILFLPGFLFGFVLNYLYENNGFNIKNFWFKFWLGFVLFVIVAMGVLAKIDIIGRLGIQSNWWIPSADVNTILRSFTGFLFGVERQASGVPPFLDFPLGIKAYAITFIIFVFTIVQAIRSWYQNVQHRSSIILISSIAFIPFILFTLTSTLNLHIFIDRYITIGGVFFFVWLAYIWALSIKRSSLILVAIYLFSLLFLIYPKPINTFSELAKTINSNTAYNGGTLVFHYPMDFVLMKYYLPDTKMLVMLPSDGGDYSSWALIQRDEEIKNPNECKGICFYIQDIGSGETTYENLNKIETNKDYYIYRIGN